jgi:hypothetical protein
VQNEFDPIEWKDSDMKNGIAILKRRGAMEASESDNLSTTEASFHIGDRKVALISRSRNKVLNARVNV